MKKFLVSLVFIPVVLLPQVPDPAYNPMTAPGATGISYNSHTLFWENPSGVLFNECYFSDDSALVANMDVSVRIQNGNPSTVYNWVDINSLSVNTRYFWRVVEYDDSGFTPSPVWYFNSKPSPVFGNIYNFDSNLDDWEIIGPLGFNNWYWSNTSAATGSPGEMVFRWDPLFIGDSYIMSPEIPSPAGSFAALSFNYYEDWWSDTVIVGCAITYDNGNNWTTLWDLHATGNVGPAHVLDVISIEGNFRLGFYYTGNSNNIDFFYVDNIIVETPLTVSHPPSLLQARTSEYEKKVTLNWNAGSSPTQISGYHIQRKTGLPHDSSLYSIIGQTDQDTFTFSDETVELNEIYTYRIATLSNPGGASHYGNEATAYVPEFVPVELASFTASVNGNNVTLNWMTASELNNRGFEIERSLKSEVKSQIWERIGFVEGKGTTTETNHYSFADKGLTPGTYQYRIKQIDFDGSIEYYNLAETIEIGLPTEYVLEQNYPNPFNPVTTIKFSIPANLETLHATSLRVYDILGNEVAILVDEFKPAGSYTINFDASQLSSGVYYNQLNLDDKVTNKKMILLK